jgi:hypothetical protein
MRRPLTSSSGTADLVAAPRLHAVADPAAQPDLVARCQRGEKEALGELYRLYRADVSRNLHRMLGPGRGDLEDVLQEVFIEVFRSIARWLTDAREARAVESQR